MKNNQLNKIFTNIAMPLHLQNPVVRETAKTTRIKILNTKKADIIVDSFYKSVARML